MVDKSSISPIRIFVVDDSEPFRRLVRSILGTSAELQVVGEAADGLEAVYKAQELRPDLILLDIGLPSLNGIEVAMRIFEIMPHPEIIFLTQESSADVVTRTLNLGAKGYIAKVNVIRDLLAAVETVVRGRQFVSAELTNPASRIYE